MSGPAIRVLVCGGRDFHDYPVVRDALDKLNAQRPIATIIEGGAPGADALAEIWAQRRRVGRISYTADWKRLGPSAGPIRNQRMLDEGKPDLVIAFPGGRGTTDMTRRARAAGVEVIEVRP